MLDKQLTKLRTQQPIYVSSWSRIEYELFGNHIIVSQKENAHTKTSIISTLFSSSPLSCLCYTLFDSTKKYKCTRGTWFWSFREHTERMFVVLSGRDDALALSQQRSDSMHRCFCEWMKSILHLAHPHEDIEMQTQTVTTSLSSIHTWNTGTCLQF